MALQYRPLDRSNREIRLLRLLPEDQDGNLQPMPSCRVMHARLRGVPRYVALSYVWGRHQDEGEILVDGQRVPVSQTLFDAVMTLRQTHGSLVIWIDFICIDQANDEEKSWQVELMKDIFRQATQVYAWLGPADQDSDRIVDYLNEFGRQAEACGIYSPEGIHQEIWRRLAESPGYSEHHHSRMPYYPVLTDGGDLHVVDRQKVEALFHSISGWRDRKSFLPVAGIERLFTRPWWSRIWVLQEITLPENAELLCGTKRISRRRCNAAISAYVALWLTLMEKGSNNATSLDSHHSEFITRLFHHRPSVMLSSWKIYRYEHFPLAALLKATCVGSINLHRHGPHHFESTDPRDKVFALLSLASDCEDLRERGVFPDYTKTCAEVYASTMVALLQQGHMSLLSCCQSAKLQSDLPSWVPDWSRSITHMLQDVENDHITLYPTFKASGVCKNRPKITVRTFNGSSRGISVDCRMYDAIDVTGNFPGRACSTEVPLSETYSWPSRWLIEILRLTYRRDRRYENFKDRLCAAAVSAIGGAGLSEVGRPTRVGDDRLSDATLLLKSGIRYLGPKDNRIKRDIGQFLATGAAESAIESLRAKSSLFPRLAQEINGKCLGRLPFVTRRGHLVLSSEHVRQGDVVALIKGTQVPFILRRSKGGAYRLISEAYVHGIMDGEAAREDKFGMVELV